MQISETKKILIACAVVSIIFVLFPSFESLALSTAVPVPLLPDAGIAEASTTPAVATSTPTATTPAPKVTPAPTPKPTTTPAPAAQTVAITKPVLLSIPSLGMKNPVIGVGTNSKGEMDVPSGTTNDVGWYEYGTMPGQVGSAVIDAHVFAAFAKLKSIQVGTLIYIKNDSGQTLTFKVEEVETYLLADVPPDKLFNRNDGQARLNLITCAGKLTPDHSTYDHRLVAYAVLVS